MAEIIDVVMRLTDQVSDKLTHIRREMEQTARGNVRLGNTVQGVGKSLGSVANTMMPLAVGITAVGTMGAKAFMDFDAQITAAAVKAGATAEELNAMRDAAGKFGAQFPITAREAAEGMDRLAAGGFNATQAIGAMPGIIEAAVASGEDLASTSDVVTSALSIWKLTTGDIAANTTHVADVIQAAANASKLGMQDFGLAMQYAGAPAAALGISIEELGTAMGIMSNNGIEASAIGTSLRATFSRLARPPREAAAALVALGITSADLQKGDGSFIGLAGAVDLLRERMSGLSDIEQVSAAKAIAGGDAYSGLLALVNTSSEAYRQMADVIENSAGSSHAAFLTMQNTLKGSMDSLIGSAEALAISFGAALAPQIRAAANELKFLADTFAGLSPEAKNLIIQVVTGVVAFTAFTLIASKVVMAVGTLITMYGQIGRVMAGVAIRNKGLQVAVQGVMGAFRLLRVGMLLMMGPIGLVVLGIAAAAVLIYKNWDRIGPFFVGLWNRIKAAFYSALAMIQPALTRLQGVWQRLMTAFQHGEGIFGVLNGLSDVLAGVLGGVLYSAIVLVAGAVTGAFTFAFQSIGAIISASIGVLSGLIDFITGVFTGNWTLAWQGVSKIFGSIFGGLSGIVESFVNGTKAAINSVIDGINGVSVTIPEWVPGYGGESFGPLNIPHLYTGTDNWRGGPAMVHDRGAEIIDLPNGTRVMPHDQSMRQAYDMGRSSGGGGNHFTIQFSGVTIQNGSDVKELARNVAREIHYEMEKHAMNRAVGAI